MQISDTFPKGVFPPPPGGNTPSIADQLLHQQMLHRRIYLDRAVRLWWYRILLIILAGIVASVTGWAILTLGQANLGQAILKGALIVVVGCVASILIFLAIRRLEFGLLLLTAVTTVFLPQLASIKSLAIFPSLPLLLILFVALVVQVAFRARERIFPSFWAIWPQIGLVVIAIISTVMVQLTWTASVPRRINSTPVIYDQLLGVSLCFIPLIAILVTTMALTKKDRYIEYIQRAFLILAFVAAAIVIIEFKRIGATVYSFRYSEPSIFWMKLKDLAHLMCLGAMIAYARLLYATRWRTRMLFAAVLAMCLMGVYFTLENSWWLEIVVALFVMTVAYSRRLLLGLCVAALPLLPLVRAELAKISTVKTADYYRLIIWQDALRVWRKQPVLGVGPGDFWVYDQRFTQLPLLLRDFAKTGLGVAHNGYLQVLAEMGPLGLFFWISSIVVIAYTALKLFRRSPMPQKQGNGFTKFIGFNLAAASEKRGDRMLGLVGFGLICGSAIADFFSGGFILPARQIDSFQWIPHALTSWIIWGCVMYRDQLWRLARKGLKINE
jgi:O-antigen ligase